METSQVLDTIGNLVAALKSFSAKVLANAPMAIPGGVKPTPEAIEHYEDTVYRFRDRAGSTYKRLPGFLLESLEAFEAGRVFDAVPPLLQALDQLEMLQQEEKIKMTAAENERVRDYRGRLHKILPETIKPEVDLPPPTS